MISEKIQDFIKKNVSSSTIETEVFCLKLSSKSSKKGCFEDFSKSGFNIWNYHKILACETNNCILVLIRLERVYGLARFGFGFYIEYVKELLICIFSVLLFRSYLKYWFFVSVVEKVSKFLIIVLIKKIKKQSFV